MKRGKYTGRKIHSLGYILIAMKNHPRSNKDGYVAEHYLIAEKALGKSLPPKAIIHHLDGSPAKNKNNNIVICENKSYHHLLHVRQRAKDAGFAVNWRKCNSCKKYDAPENMRFEKRALDNSTVVLHKNGCPKGSFVGKWKKAVSAHNTNPICRCGAGLDFEPKKVKA